MKKTLCILLSLLITASCFASGGVLAQGEETDASQGAESAMSMSDLPIGPSGKSFIHNPTTYTNPISLTQGSERVLTSGEPVVKIFNDDYYLFIRGRRGYWWSHDFVDWTYVDAPNLLGGIVGITEIDGKLYNYAGNTENRVRATDDPKTGIWYDVGTFSSNNYGDASMLYDEDSGRLFMYYGWSQLLGIRVVELDKKTFKEIGKPVVAIWGDPHNHGWETRYASDNIFPLFSHRQYRAQEYGWTEGGHPLKYNGKYYLMYASIGLEFFSYGHGVYVADDPLGPYVYDEHNPLTLKTTGVAPGGGHGSIFLDKQGKVWTIAMLPYALNGGFGNTLISLFPSDVDAEGTMYGNVEYGDYPQYLPGVKTNPVKDNYTRWTLLSLDKRVETSSTYESATGQYWPAFAVDEDPKSYWSAKTGDPGEYITVDLGEVSDIRGIQVLWDRAGATGNQALSRYQSYTVEVSDDNQDWTLIIDKSNNPQDLRSDYIELPVGVTGRYVKLTNVFTPDNGRFAVKALRAFGNPETSTFTKVNNVKAVRSKLDRRYAHLLWEPVDGAEGYLVRYGIEPNKLYNSYVVYWDTYLNIPSLNVDPEYYFEVEAFSSGTPRYVENTFETRGRGAELDLVRQPTGGASSTDRIMTYETYGKDEVYVFDNITPGTYTLNHTFGVGIWGPQQLTQEQLIGTGEEPTVTALNLTQFGIGSTQWGTVEVRVYPGETSGRIEVTFKYDTAPDLSDYDVTVDNVTVDTAQVEESYPTNAPAAAAGDSLGQTNIGTSSSQPAESAMSMSDLPITPSGKSFIHNPTTYTNPISLTQGSERVLTSGEPVVKIFKDDYYLFIRGRRGYWWSHDFVDWTYVDAPNLLGGIVGITEIDGKLYNYAGNRENRVRATDDPKTGVWYDVGTFSSNNYGDASMLYDEDTGRLFMYYGWSQLLGIRVVELDKTTFKEIGKPVVAIWGDPYNHGWETRYASDNIFPLFSHRQYRTQEYGWTEGGHPLKYNGKYYLMYASIGLEFYSYGHGVYVADDPLGPYVYDEHNPLTLKTTGVAPGGGHGSIWLDKQGKVWTIAMLPYALNGASGNTLISLFPSDVDAEGVMHGKVEYGDYPQYLPGVKANPIKDNYTNWTLLSLDKRVETSSTYEVSTGQYWPAYAVDEDPKSYWSAKTGDPGEYITVDLGEVSDIRGIQVLWDRAGATGNQALSRYQSYTVEVSDDNQDWTLIIDKSNNPQDLRSDYIELPVGVTGRYVKLTNVFTPDNGRFAVKALRAFGNPETSTFTKVDNDKVMAVRSKLDRRYAHLLWEPVDGAEGYLVRYGIEPGKLYNSYMVYWDTYLNIPSLNVSPEYYFEVEAFSSGTPRYVENTFETRGRGAELDLVRRPTGGASSTDRIMTYETYGKDEVYVFDNITHGSYTLNHTFGVGIWGPQQLTQEQLIGTGEEPTVTALNLTQFGIGSTQWGTVEVRVYPGETSGKIEVTFKYDTEPDLSDQLSANIVLSEENGVLAKYQIVNNKGEFDANVVCILAVYDKGQLVGILQKPVMAPKGSSALYDMKASLEPGQTAKGYVWRMPGEGFSGSYAPVCTAVEWK